MKQFVAREHEIEPIPGLPGHLPAGEEILWQGRPSARLVARHVLKSTWIGGYFVVLALWAAAAGVADGQPAGGILFSVAVLIGLAGLALGLLELFAWAVERTTLYTVTSERVVMRFGVALSMTLNLPFSQIDTVALGRLGGRSGTIAMALRKGYRLSWMVQWPHVRGWRFASPEPSLICLPDAEAVAAVLTLAYGQHASARSDHPRLRVAANSVDAVPHAVDAE
ncbi:photosynthetic complex putative assembly protein PuhB [Niveispirillum sp.]|uniref:photosynthetic complex putative assembly protein PuhB n=1 Tax=Niveispirillum sp. TaxID=1917217 RepID=UPI001B520F66|nr:photosynthetic complex putative assembly protein PuhB [Niveispirillum sp.]MBP7339754.1 PH domain-containing protein [Niveispirillum sp.]